MDISPASRMAKKKTLLILLKLLNIQRLIVLTVTMFMVIFLVRITCYSTVSPDFKQWHWTHQRHSLSRTNNETPFFYVRQNGDYWILYNYIVAKQHFDGNESITLTTHCDYKNLRHLPALVNRWRAPISVAIYASGRDFDSTIDAIRYLYDCVPSSPLIRRYITFSLCIHTDHKPNAIAATEHVIFQQRREHCELPFREHLLTYREEKKLEYPVNVLRNIGRLTATTYFVLPLDVHVLPLPDFVPKFLLFIDTMGAIFTERSYFCMVTFELPENITSHMPVTKETLKLFIKQNITHQAFQNPSLSIDNSMSREDLLQNLLKTWLSYRPSANPDLYDIVQNSFTELLVILQLYGVTINPWEPLYDEVYMLTNPNHLTSQYDLLLELNYKFYLMDKTFLLKRQGTEPVSLLPYERSNMQPTLVLKENHLLYKIQKILPNG